MEIIAQGISKSFNRNTLFKELSFSISQNEKWVILGPNGAGKSTLLHILAGFSLPTQGSIIYSLDNKSIDESSWYAYFSFAGTYQETIEEFSPAELFQLQYEVGKTITDDLDYFLGMAKLLKEKNKPVKYFSSGMKQRLKLALAFYAPCPILFLDEPTANLDQENCNWYHELFETYSKQKTVVLSSNIPTEYQFFKNRIELTN